jgi:hypothetical protein
MLAESPPDVQIVYFKNHDFMTAIDEDDQRFTIG